MNAPVLVLNANFEPVMLQHPSRHWLILSGKADMVMNGRGTIQTVRQTLRGHPHPAGPNDPPAAPQIKCPPGGLSRDDYTCQYCGRHTAC